MATVIEHSTTELITEVKYNVLISRVLLFSRSKWRVSGTLKYNNLINTTVTNSAIVSFQEIPHKRSRGLARE